MREDKPLIAIDRHGLIAILVGFTVAMGFLLILALLLL